MEKQPVRTRIAPSPTGEDLHIGTVYMALFNYVFAKKHGGQFIVRIEDTDRERYVEGAEARMITSLDWIGLPRDEDTVKGGPFAPYRQSERLPMYKKYAEQLVMNGQAYYCFCTADRLIDLRAEQQRQSRPPMYDGLCKAIAKEKAEDLIETQMYVVRLNVPKSGETSFHDVIRGDIRFQNSLIDDQVLLKSDGFPTYHLAVVVDDYLMKITHVLRGEEWISSTPKHILLYQGLGWEIPHYAHLPLLRNLDKSKLSKRRNPVWISWFRKQGFLPEALLNYLGTLTWNMPDGKDLFTLSDMIAEFNLNNVKTTAPIFDLDKLRWFNKQYLMKQTPEKFVTLVRDTSVYWDNPHFQTIAERTASLVQPRLGTITEYDSMAGFFFKAPKPQTFERQVDKELVRLLYDYLKQATWEHDALEKGVRKLAEQAGIKSRDLFMELRMAITGKSVGPPLLGSLLVLGKEDVVNRLKILF